MGRLTATLTGAQERCQRGSLQITGRTMQQDANERERAQREVKDCSARDRAASWVFKSFAVQTRLKAAKVRSYCFLAADEAAHEPAKDIMGIGNCMGLRVPNQK